MTILTNLVPSVFSLFKMAAAREKTLAHSRSRGLQRGWRCIQNGGYGEKGEKNWVRDAKVKINKWREKAEVQEKQTRFACKSLRNTAKC